jgi:hypothetical protein
LSFSLIPLSWNGVQGVAGRSSVVSIVVSIHPEKSRHLLQQSGQIRRAVTQLPEWRRNLFAGWAA